MAFTKWIPFAVQSPNNTPIPPPPEVAPVVSCADGKQFGLENFGNTCYANSVLQALYFCGPFRELVLQYPDPSFPDLTLPPPVIPPSPSPSPPPPQNHARPKPSRKFSISESSSPNQNASCSSPVTKPSVGLPIPAAPPTLLSALRSLYIHISRNPADKGTVAPRAFIDKLKELNELFRSTMHQDAHEFLNYLLNQIVEEMEEDRKRTQSGQGNGSSLGEDMSASVGTLSSVAAPSSIPTFFNNTLVHRLFEGVLTSETRCLTCETVSSRDESFLDLSIDIEQNSSVTACLRQFSASEMLCQRNKFFCDSCCDLQEAEKRMKIKKLPNVLALHLKRFKYQEDVQKYIKLAYRVAFPFELRLFNTVDDAPNADRLYELFAIVVHIGNGPHHGHYVSIIKARGIWYLFDDDTVETIKEADIPKYFGDSNSGSAYVLYYQAVDLDVTSLGLPPPEPTAASDPAADSSMSQSTTLFTTLESGDSVASSPALPPGLTPDPSEDGRKSSTAPPSPVPFISPVASSSSQSSSVQTQPLSLSIPSSQSRPDATPSSPAGPRGFFGSLRHSPSVSLRMRPQSSGNGAEQRKSTVDIPPVPPIPSTSASNPLPESSTSPPSAYVAPSPQQTPLTPNGKEKDKSWSGGWLKRKSFRAEKPVPVISGLPGERSGPIPNAELLDDGSVPWYKSKRVSRRASEIGLASSMPSSPMTSASPGSNAPTPTLGSVPENKKSSPELANGHHTPEKRTHRQRPSTAGASIERPKSTVPTSLPPMPSSPAMPSSYSHPPTNGSANGSTGGLSHKQQRPHTSHAPISPSALGFSASNATTSTLSTDAGQSSTSSGTGGKTKRAGRKLSFNAPMLGFGRRDKERERRPQSPAVAVGSHP